MVWLFFSLKGRLNRAYFWYGSIVIMVAFFILGFLVQEIWKELSDFYDSERIAWISLSLMSWPIFAISVKRCHDLDKPWWVMLFGLIPVLGVIAVMYLAFFRGTEGPNQYGPDPCPRPDRVFILNEHLRLKSGRIRHKELLEDQIQRIREIFLILFEVYPLSYNEWIDGFRRDRNPESEIRIWQYTARFFAEYCADHDFSPAERQEVFTIIIFCLCIREDEIIQTARLKEISKGQAEDVIREYKASDILPAGIRRLSRD